MLKSMFGLCFQEDMKQMPRVATFLKSVMSYHTTFPSEKEAKEAKNQPKVSAHTIKPLLSFLLSAS